MALTNTQLQLLKTELLTDPRGYGYAANMPAGQPPNVQILANIVSAVRDGTNPPSNPTADGGAANGAIIVRRDDITGGELRELIDSRDIAGANNQYLVAAWFQSVLSADNNRLIDDGGNDTRVFGNLKRLVINTNGSQNRLTNAANRFGSRAEEKLGRNTNVLYSDVADALALP